MFAPANQTHFSLSLPAIEHDLQVLEFTGHEALSQPFVFELTLVSERPDLDLAALLGQPAFLALDAQGNGIHALVHSAAQGDSGQRLTRYHLTLRPRLAWLG
ncbi:contractile injection system protein, VgrG/Pvc8 family, partial [Pseudomonas sp. GOM6]|uniref:contractile injection system protein, VgrG/Pvc8 family n=1 Tax=Pseudomonas sp. GOM6 TaxID=3036944 RepID=UPI002409A624